MNFHANKEQGNRMTEWLRHYTCDPGVLGLSPFLLFFVHFIVIDSIRLSVTVSCYLIWLIPISGCHKTYLARVSCRMPFMSLLSYGLEICGRRDSGQGCMEGINFAWTAAFQAYSFWFSTAKCSLTCTSCTWDL